MPGRASWCRRNERRPRARRGDEDVRLRSARSGVAGCDVPRRRGRARRHPRPLGVGEVDASPSHGDARAAERRTRVDHRARRGADVGPRARRGARDAHRVRVPAVLPRRARDRARERGGRLAVQRRRRGRSPGARSGGVDARRPRRSARCAPDAAVRRRTTACRDRARARRSPRHRPRGRADGESRQRERRRDHAADRRAERRGRDDRRHHARARDRRALPASDHAARRPGRVRRRPKEGRMRIVVSALVITAVLAVGAGSSSAAGTACPTSNYPNELVLAGGSAQTAQLGRPFQSPLQVELANTNGCPLTGNLAGVTVEFDAPGSGASGIFASSGTHVAVVGTDAQGTATAPAFTANDTVGEYSVDAQSDYGTVNIDLNNTASGLPSAIAATSGTSQDATVDTQYAQALQARVADANGDAVQGAVVSFSVVPGPTGANASFLGGGPASAVTDSNGLATAPPLLAGATPGKFSATASTDGLASVAVFSLDNHADAMALTVIADAARTATVDTRYRAPLHVRVIDGNGQPLEGASVTFAIGAAASGAGASFVGGSALATALTDVNGVGTSPGILANRVSGAFTITASAPGAPPASFSFTNVAARAASIAVGAANGSSATVGTRFAVPLAVTVSDKDGNPVAHAKVVFTAPTKAATGRFTHKRRRITVTTGVKGIAVAPRFTASEVAG